MIRSIVTLALSLTISMAASASGLAEQVQRCQEIDNDASRLDCFDAIGVEASKPGVGRPVEPSSARQEAAAPVATPSPRSEEDIPVRSEVVEIKKTIDNRHIFYLKDGSVWLQSRSSHRRYKEGVQVVVRRVGPRGAFSSYRMEMGDHAFRVVKPE